MPGWAWLGVAAAEAALVAAHSPAALLLPFVVLGAVLIGHQNDSALVLACIGLLTVSWDRVSIRFGGMTLKPAYVAFGAALVIDLAQQLRDGRQRSSALARFTRRTVVALLALLAAATVRSGFPIDGARQLVVVLLGAVVPAWACFRLGRSPKRRAVLVSWALTGAALAATIGVYQFASSYLHLPAFLVYTPRVGALGRTAGLSYEPAFFSMYLVSMVPVAVLMLMRSGSDIGPVQPVPRPSVLFCILLLGILVANARAGYLALPLALLLPLIGRSWRRRVLIRPVALLCGAFVFVALASAVVRFDLATYTRTRLASITDTRESASNAPRLRLYSTDRRIATDHLLLGIGPGALGHKLPEYGLPLSEYFQGSPLTDRSRVVANNIWLQAVLDCGVGGVLGVVLILGVLFRLGRRCQDPYGRWLAVGCLLAFIIGGALTSLFWDAKYWALIGIALAADMRPIERPDDASSTATAGPAFAGAEQVR